MSEANPKPVPSEPESFDLDKEIEDLEKEIEVWTWARAAGVSAQDLDKALRDSLRRQESV